MSVVEKPRSDTAMNDQQVVHGRLTLRRRFTPRAMEPIRRLMEAWLGLWELADLADPCLLIISELCSNVRHAQDPRFELRVSVLDGHLRMDVRDHSDLLPKLPGRS